MVSYDATTDAVTVTVRPVYLDDRSEVIESRFVHLYFVQIENHGLGEVQLLRRRWIITDANGAIQEIEGEGVVGRQPVVAPDEMHEYHSFCVLPTFEGTMEGSYLMQREDGSRFRAEIPKFHLRALAN